MKKQKDKDTSNLPFWKTYRKNLLFLVLIIVLSGVLAWVPRNYLIQQFAAFQNRQTERNIVMVKYALQTEENSLNNICGDWAKWDDMYEFVQDHNQGFIDSNLQIDYLKKSTKIDLISIYNRDKQKIWADIYQADRNEKPQNKELLQEQIDLLGSNEYSEQVSGYMFTSYGLMVISISPILPSSGAGETQGRLVMGRIINEGLLQDISQHIQLTLQLPATKDDALAQKHILHKLKGSNFVIDKDEMEHPLVHMNMQDFYGEEFVISFKMPHNIMTNGTKAANFASIAFIAALVMVVASFLFAFRLYSSKVKRNRQELADLLEKRSQELAESEERYRQLFNNADDSIYTIDIDFILLEANRNTYERLGYSREDVIGQNVSVFLPPGSKASLINWRDKVLEAKKIRFEGRQRKKDGSIMHVEVTSQLVEHQDRLEIFNIARDITRRKQAEKAFQTSERRYRTIFENSPIGIVYLNSSAQVLSANSKMLTIAGMSIEQLGGKKLFECLTDFNMAEKIKKAVDGVTASHEIEYTNKLDEKSQQLRLIFSPIIIGEKPFDVICLVEDVTDLRESEARTSNILNTVQAGIVLIDAETRRVVEANPSALKMFSDSKMEISGKLCHEIFCTADNNTCPVLDLGKMVDSSEQKLIRADGSELPILKSVTMISFGRKTYLLESFLDLSERKAIEVELQEAKEAAEAANRSKSVFLANMSHEIRTPMNAILGYAQLMKHDDTIEAKHHRSLDIINSSANHLLQLIDDILEMSKIEAGRSVLHEVHCDFEALLQDMENMFQLRASEKNVQLLLERINEFPRYIMVDEGKVRQIMVNLLGNAMKFTDEGSIVIRIEQTPCSYTEDELDDLLLETGHFFITIEVEDSGCGISETGARSIFGAFVQAEEGRAQGTGTGLGLTISRDFARLLGGDLVLVRSQLGIGSLFRLTFKCREIDAELYNHNERKERKVQAIASTGRGWKVLVVDDRYTNRDFLKQMLTRIGFLVREAVDGEEGFLEYQAWHPDIILMDLMMPRLDGYDAIKRIREQQDGFSPVIIAISASVMDGNGEKAMEAGADGFLRKPFRESELLEYIHKMCDIEYIYAAADHPYELVALNSQTKKDITLHHNTSRIPDELITALLEAVENGDMMRLNLLIDEALLVDKELAEYLHKLADNYEYATLIELLDRRRNPHN